MSSLLKRFTFKHKKNILEADSNERAHAMVKSPEPVEVAAAAGLDTDGPNRGRALDRIVRDGGRARAQSDASGFTRRAKVTAVSMSSMDDGAAHNPPHYIMYHMDRRRALGAEELCRSLGTLNAIFGSGEQLDAAADGLEPVMTIILSTSGGDSKREVMKTRVNQTMRELIEEAMIKNGYDIEYLDSAPITASQNGSSVTVDLDTPSHQYLSSTVEVGIHGTPGEDGREEDSPVTTLTIKDCLDHFSHNGLVELPSTRCDEDSYHLPRVDPPESIPHSWNDLPIPTDLKSSMTMKQLDLQLKIWELIATEHSHLSHLKTVINLFMQSLELIRQAHLLVEDSYHNVFGYMEDIHNAHEDFWNHTLHPCLDKTLRNGCLLDMDEILQRFPQFSAHFDIYRQHCPLESLNLQALAKAMLNHDFEAYINWCESRPQCKRLRLKDFLAMPMQRLTKYPLLLEAILKALVIPQQREALTRICDEVKVFVQSVNSVVRIQEETERVRDAMTRISDYVVMDNPPQKLKEELRSHRLDLLAPMPGVEVDQPRMLLLEGSLKYRDQQSSAMVVHVFLFTDLMLITKPTKNKYIIVKPPYKITSIVLQTLEPDSIGVIVLSDYLDVVSTWFILKASSEPIVKSWMERITSAQQLYRDALERQEVNWRTVQCLRSERILNGIERHYPADHDLDQSRWSIHSNAGEPDVAEGTGSPLPLRLNLMRTRSAETHDTLSSPSTSTTGTQATRYSTSSEAILSPRGVFSVSAPQPRHLSIPQLQSKGHSPGSPRQGRRAYSVDAGTQTDLLFSMPQRSSSSFDSVNISSSGGSLQELTSSGMLDQPGHPGTRPSKHLHGDTNHGAMVADVLEGGGGASPYYPSCATQHIKDTLYNSLSMSEGYASRPKARRTSLKKCSAYDNTPPHSPPHIPSPSPKPFTAITSTTLPPSSPFDAHHLVPAKSPSQLPLLQVEDYSNTSPSSNHFTWDIVMLNYPPGLVPKQTSTSQEAMFPPSQQAPQPEPDSSKVPPLSRARKITAESSPRREQTQIPVPVWKLSKASPRKEPLYTTRELSATRQLSRSDEELIPQEQTSPKKTASRCSSREDVPSKEQTSPKKTSRCSSREDVPSKEQTSPKKTSRRSSREDVPSKEHTSSPSSTLKYKPGSFRRVQRVGRQTRPGSGGDRKLTTSLPEFDVWLRSHVRRTHHGKGGGAQMGGKAMSPIRKVSTMKPRKSLVQAAELNVASPHKHKDSVHTLERSATQYTSKTSKNVSGDVAGGIGPEGASPAHRAHRPVKHSTSAGSLPAVPSASVKRTRSAIPVKSASKSLSLELYEPTHIETSCEATFPAPSAQRPAMQKMTTVPPLTLIPRRRKHSSAQPPCILAPSRDGYNPLPLHESGSGGPPPQSTKPTPPQEQTMTSPLPPPTYFQTKPLQQLKDPPPQQVKASPPNDTKVTLKHHQSAPHLEGSSPRATPLQPTMPTSTHPPPQEAKMINTCTQTSKTHQESNTNQQKDVLSPVITKEAQSPTAPPSHHHHGHPHPPSQHNDTPPAPPSQHHTTTAPSSQKRHTLFQMSHRRYKSYPAIVPCEEQQQSSGHHGTTHKAMELRPSSLNCSGLLSIEEEGVWSPVHSICNLDIGANSM